MDIKTVNERPNTINTQNANLKLGQQLNNFGNDFINRTVDVIKNDLQKQKQVELNNKILDFATQGQIELADFKNKNALSPDDEKARSNLFSKINSDAERLINEVPYSQRVEARNRINELIQKGKNDIAIWSYEQGYKNGLDSIQNQITGLNKLGTNLGMKGDFNNAIYNLSLVGENIKQNASLYLGEEQANKIKEGLNKDYYTSFFSGLLNNFPEQVLNYIDDDYIKNIIGTEEAEKLKKSATTKLEQIRKFTIQKDVANLMTQEKDMVNNILNSNIDFVSLNNFIESNKDKLNKSTIDYLLNIAGFSSSDSGNSTKRTIEDKIKAEMEIEKNLTLFSIDPKKYDVNSYKELQDRVFEYANSGLLDKTKTRQYIDRINDYSTQLNLYSTQTEYENNKLNKEDKTVGKLLKEVDEISKRLGYYELNSKGKEKEGYYKNILGNEKIINNKNEVNGILNSILSIYNENKTNNILRSAMGKGVVLGTNNDNNINKIPISVYLNSLSNSEISKIEKEAKEESIKQINDTLNIDTFNKSPMENMSNLNNYIYSKIQENNNLIIEEEINKRFVEKNPGFVVKKIYNNN